MKPKIYKLNNKYEVEFKLKKHCCEFLSFLKGHSNLPLQLIPVSKVSVRGDIKALILPSI